MKWLLSLCGGSDGGVGGTWVTSGLTHNVVLGLKPMYLYLYLFCVILEFLGLHGSFRNITSCISEKGPLAP